MSNLNHFRKIALNSNIFNKNNRNIFNIFNKNHINIKRNPSKTSWLDEKFIVELNFDNKYHAKFVEFAIPFGAFCGAMVGCNINYNIIKNQLKYGINELMLFLPLICPMILISSPIIGACGGLISSVCFPFIVLSFVVGYSIEKLKEIYIKKIENN